MYSNRASLRFSVVIPVYEQWELVTELLDCLERQTFERHKFEIILVDNGSAGTATMPRASSALKVLHCEKPGSYAARNLGAQSANGDWLVFTDADCRPVPEWLEQLEDFAKREDQGRAILVGAVEIVSNSGDPGPWEVYDLVIGIAQERYAGRGYGATANLAVPRSLFNALGGFDGNRLSGGDAEFCRRAGAQGSVTIYVPQARVDHPARKTREQIATKARRVKGGQLKAGPFRRRLMWTAATVAPPLRRMWWLLRAKKHPFRYRLTAISVLFQIWFVELGELFRLSAGGQPERR